MPVGYENYDDFQRVWQNIKGLTTNDSITRGEDDQPVLKGKLTFLEEARNVFYNPKESQLVNSVVFFIDFLKNNQQHIKTEQDVKDLIALRNRFKYKSSALVQCIDEVIQPIFRKSLNIMDIAQASTVESFEAASSKRLGLALLEDEQCPAHLKKAFKQDLLLEIGKDPLNMAKACLALERMELVRGPGKSAYFQEVLVDAFWNHSVKLYQNLPPGAQKKMFDTFKKYQENNDDMKHLMGICYLNGIGVQQDKTKGLEILQELALKQNIDLGVFLAAEDIQNLKRAFDSKALETSKKESIEQESVQAEAAQPTPEPSNEAYDASKDLAFHEVWKQLKGLDSNHFIKLEGKKGNYTPRVCKKWGEHELDYISIMGKMIYKSEEGRLSNVVIYLIGLIKNNQQYIKTNEDFEILLTIRKCFLNKSIALTECIDNVMTQDRYLEKIEEHTSAMKKDAKGFLDQAKEARKASRVAATDPLGVLLLQEEDTKDVVFHCQDGKQIKAHGQILRAYKESFFSIGLYHQIGGNQEIMMIQTENYPVASVEALIKILYGTAHPSQFSPSIQLDLFMLADQFLLFDLKNECEKALFLKIGEHPLNMANAWSAYDHLIERFPGLESSEPIARLRDVLIQAFCNRGITSYLRLSQKAQRQMAEVFFKHQEKNEDLKPFAAACYLYGIGVKKDQKLALEILGRLTAVQNQKQVSETLKASGWAHYVLGNFFIGEKENEKGMQILQEGADQEFGPAAASLGAQLAFSVKGFTSAVGQQKAERAFNLYSKAEALGIDPTTNSSLQVLLGYLCTEGLMRVGSEGEDPKKMSEQQKQKAFEHFKQAADLGSRSGQFHVGLCYEMGSGVGKNQALANKYYTLSANQGDEDALKKLPKKDQVLFSPTNANKSFSLMHQIDERIAEEPQLVATNLLTQRDHARDNLELAQDVVAAATLPVHKAVSPKRLGETLLQDDNHKNIIFLCRDEKQIKAHGQILRSCENSVFSTDLRPEHDKDELEFTQTKGYSADSVEAFVKILYGMAHLSEFKPSIQVQLFMLARDFRISHLETQFKEALRMKIKENPLNLIEMCEELGYIMDNKHLYDENHIDVYISLFQEILMEAFHDHPISSYQKLPQTDQQRMFNTVRMHQANNDAMRMLFGLCYLDGIGVDKNAEEGMRILREEANKGNEWAQMRMYIQLLGEIERREEQLIPLLKITDLDNEEVSRGKQQILNAHEKRKEELANYLKIKNLDALLHLSEIFYVNKDYKSAILLYKLAVALKEPRGMIRLGLSYERGLGVDKDLEKAFQYYQQAADLGDLKGMVYVGVCYEEGLGVNKDLQQAFQYYQRAANLNYTQGMVHLGLCYGNGVGVDKNLQQAFQYHQQAALLGDAGGMAFLGNCYEKGVGVKEDRREAFKWYEQSAKLNNPAGQFYYAECYQYAYEVAKDENLAIEWYRKSAAQGYSQAKERLKKQYNIVV